MNRIKIGINELYLDLLDDCEAFDKGNQRKAKDIAGRLRTLLKDGPGKNSVSILKQLNSNYEKFIQGDSLEFIANDVKIIFKNSPAKNSIRQIGYEVLLTMRENLNYILNK